MKKLWISVILAVLVVAASVGIPYFVNSIKADSVDYTETIIDDNSGTGGSSTAGSNNFLIVEIVPYVGMGEIGYLVGGYEPIDGSLMNKSTAQGMLNFLGSAISIYYSNTTQSIASASARHSGWSSVQTYVKQNGYFKYVGPGMGEYEKQTNQTVYTRSVNNTGNTKAVLSGDSLAVYKDLDSQNNGTGAENDQINYKNVNAYFVYGNTSGASLYNATTYAPVSVKKNTTRTGNYDYNCDTMSFTLNKGHGKYDVLFTPDGNGKYYVLANYEIVDDCSGEYSWAITYSNASGNGNFISSTQALNFKYHIKGDRTTCNYTWVEADTTGKTNFQQEGTAGDTTEKVWVLGQKVVTWKEYKYSVFLVNNEWIKREVLDLSNDHIDDVNVKVVTMTPQQLNDPANQHYLDEADLFYINAKYDHNVDSSRSPANTYCYLYENYNQYGRALPNAQKFAGLYSANKLGFGDNDLSWGSTMKIFNRIAGVKANGSLGGYRAAVVFDDTYYQYAVGDMKDPPYYSNLYTNYRKNVSPYYKYVNYIDYLGNPVYVTDYPSFDNQPATVCNLAKLYIMLKQRRPTDFYNLFLKNDAPFKITVNSSSNYNSTHTTGSFVPPGATNYSEINSTFWNENTFSTYYLDDNGNYSNPKPWEINSIYVPNYNIDNQNTDLIQNVVSMNGSEIFNQGFIAMFYGMPPDALAEAQIYLNTNSGAIKFSDYIKVATDTGTGYGNATEDMTDSFDSDGASGSNYTDYTSVLNIEPTADFKQSEINIKKMLSAYTIKITNMTSTQFNSSIEDINTQYDLIYIGAGVNRFNSITVNNVKTTAFNNILLDGKAYISGDLVSPLSSVMTYTGNDLTSQKVAELNDYMDAGYPIVMEKSVYTLSDVQSGTRISSFIQSARSNYTANCLNFDKFISGYASNSSDYKSFMQKVIAAFKIEQPQIKMDHPPDRSSTSIQPVTVSGEKVNYSYVDPVTNKLHINFLVLPNGTEEEDSNYYNAYIYVDFNEDGIFSPTELLNENVTTGTTKNFHASKLLIHQYVYNMSSYNGICHWKVEVIRQKKNANNTYSDTNIRSEVTGYAAYSNKETIKILQITDNSSDTTAYSLENAVSSTSSLIKKYAGYGLIPLSDYKLDFTTMTVSDFLQQYATSPYSINTDATTNKLKGYHLIILDNQTDKLNNSYGAITNLKTEIGKGLGVIFTGNAINYTRQTCEYSGISQFALFENQKTDWALTYKTVPSILTLTLFYVYDFDSWGYSDDLLKNLSTYKPTAATKSNDGANTQYPYKIDDSIKISSDTYIPTTSSYLQDTTVDYNMGSNISTNPPLVGWYSLSDSKASSNTGIFSVSPNDVKNSYYLFNKGKVYYSAIQLDQADVANNDMEIKLFINTIIACYKSTGGRIVATPPVVTINNSVKNVDKNTQYLYIDIDYATGSEGSGNLDGANPIKLKFKVTGATGNVSVGLTGLTDSTGADVGVVNNRIYKENDSSVNYMLNVKSVPAGDSNNYYVLIPAKLMCGVSTKDITVTASSDASTSGSSTVTLLRRSLFQLD